MGLLQDGQAMLTQTLAAAAGVSVVYSRTVNGVTVSTTLTAWVGRTLFAGSNDTNGARVEWGERDYLIPVASLKLNGVAVIPQKQTDRITETINGTPVVFELQTPTGEPVWRFSDQYRTLYRVHCKRVS